MKKTLMMKKAREEMEKNARVIKVATIESNRVMLNR